MFKSLRLQLTLLYLVASLTLVVLVGGAAYQLMSHYLLTTTDAAMKQKMTLELQRLGATVPPELLVADAPWYANLPQLLPRVQRNAVRKQPDDDRERHREDDDDREGAISDGELAAVFVLPLDANGRLLFNPNPYAPPMPPDTTAARAALTKGVDWRSVRLSDGTRVRLLTYRLDGSQPPTLLQVGRSLVDQDRVLGRLLVGLGVLGGASSVVLGGASWWLAGRTLLPTQRAWERQQTFVANASHELRAPLTLIRASAEMVRRRLPEDDDQRPLIDDILSECDHMSSLVNDLLLLSRLDSAQLKLERKPIDLAELLADVQRQIGRLADERGVALTTAGANGVIWGDPTRMRQTLIILLDNALRHTPPGGSVHLEARPSRTQIEISVADTGSGIAPEYLPHVFERFYRVPGDRQDQREGAGLGLAIAKALVEGQGGVIRLDSKLGFGTRVMLAMPRAS